MSKKTKQTKTKRGKTQSQKQKQTQIVNIKIGDTNKSKARKRQQKKPLMTEDKQPDTTKQQPSVNIVNQLPSPSVQPFYQPQQIIKSIESQKVGENVTNDLLRSLINLQSRPLTNSIKTYDDYNYDNISEISDYKDNISQFSQPTFFNDNISELTDPTFYDNIPSKFISNKPPSIISSIKSNNSFYSENLNDINRDDNIDKLEKTNVSNIFYDDNNIVPPLKSIPPPPPPPPPLKSIPPPPQPLNLLDQINSVNLKNKNEQGALAPPPLRPKNIFDQIKEGVNLSKVNVQEQKSDEKVLSRLDDVLQKISKATRGNGDDESLSAWDPDEDIIKPITKKIVLEGNIAGENLKDINRDDKIDTAEKTNIFVPENLEDIILINKQTPQPQQNVLEEIIAGKKIEDIIPPPPPPPPPPPNPEVVKTQEEINQELDEIRKKRVSFFEKKNKENEETKKQIKLLSDGVNIADELLRSILMDTSPSNIMSTSKITDRINVNDFKLYKELVEKYKLLDIKQIRSRPSYKNVLDRLSNSTVLNETRKILDDKKKEDEQEKEYKKKEDKQEKKVRYPSRGRAEVKTLIGGGEGGEELVEVIPEKARSKTPSKIK